ncbi:hypothetical protein DSO57_1014560 [Entomophthora muscae]|uniref:Uncharacterized protein n=1 Tax=Entomophthora muscae TaxID=34485 RepID=A0ACC2SUI4_9FUNG|nr:hypothetical protein DSO57_1014560 [Entomophthora muscae]
MAAGKAKDSCPPVGCHQKEQDDHTHLNQREHAIEGSEDRFVLKLSDFYSRGTLLSSKTPTTTNGTEIKALPRVKTLGAPGGNPLSRASTASAAHSKSSNPARKVHPTRRYLALFKLLWLPAILTSQSPLPGLIPWRRQIIVTDYSGPNIRLEPPPHLLTCLLFHLNSQLGNP